MGLSNEIPHLVSVHIEKTAGTSLQEYFIRLFGADRVLQYLPLSKELARNSDLRFQPTNMVVDLLKCTLNQSKIRSIFAQLYSSLNSEVLNPKIFKIEDLPNLDYAVLHGHFVADQFINQVKNPLYAVILKEPLSRMFSHYTNWYRAKGQSPWRFMLDFDPSLTFEDFALLPQMQNYQVQALGAIDITAFTFVGATEKLNNYLVSVNQGLKEYGVLPEDTELGFFRWLNRTPRKPIYDLDLNFREKFKQFHALDYDLYEYALGKN